MVETLRLPFRIFLPILLMVLISLFTPRNDREALDRFYVKMRTPVRPDPQEDRREMEESYRNPGRFDHTKLFPGSSIELAKWTREDTVGFLLGVLGVLLVIGLTLWVASIGG